MTFTIKHIGSDGAEQIISCGSFFAERTSNDNSVSYCVYKGHHRGTELLNIWSGEIQHDSMANRAVIYVVNEKGATVAIHRYDDSAYMLHATTPPPPPPEQLPLPLQLDIPEGGAIPYSA